MVATFGKKMKTVSNKSREEQ